MAEASEKTNTMAKLEKLEGMTREELQKQVKRKVQLIQKLKTKYDELNGKYEESETGRISMIKSLEILFSKNNVTCMEELNSKIQSFRENLIKVENEKGAMVSKCNNMEEQLQCLLMKSKSLEDTCKCFQSEICNLTSSNKELKCEVNLLIAARDEAVKSMKTSSEKLKQSYEQKIRDLETRNNNLKLEIQQFSDAKSQNSYFLNETKSEFSDISKVNEELIQEKNNREETTVKLQEIIRELENRTEKITFELENDRNEHRVKLESFTQEIELLKSKFCDFEAEITLERTRTLQEKDILNQNLKNSMLDIEKYKQQLDEYENDIQKHMNLEKENDELIICLKELKTENYNLSEKLEEKSAELSEINNHLSAIVLSMNSDVSEKIQSNENDAKDVFENVFLLRSWLEETNMKVCAQVARIKSLETSLADSFKEKQTIADQLNEYKDLKQFLEYESQMKEEAEKSGESVVGIQTIQPQINNLQQQQQSLDSNVGIVPMFVDSLYEKNENDIPMSEWGWAGEGDWMKDEEQKDEKSDESKDVKLDEKDEKSKEVELDQKVKQKDAGLDQKEKMMKDSTKFELTKEFKQKLEDLIHFKKELVEEINEEHSTWKSQYDSIVSTTVSVLEDINAAYKALHFSSKHHQLENDELNHNVEELRRIFVTHLREMAGFYSAKCLDNSSENDSLDKDLEQRDVVLLKEKLSIHTENFRNQFEGLLDRKKLLTDEVALLKNEISTLRKNIEVLKISNSNLDEELKRSENRDCNSCEKLTEKLAETESQLKELELCAEQFRSKDEEIEKLKIHIEESNNSKLLIAGELKEMENKACKSREKLTETERQLKEHELCAEQSKSKNEEIEKLKIHIEELNNSNLIVADELKEMENKACNSREKLTETERQLKELKLCAQQSQSKDDEIEKLKIHVEELNNSNLIVADELKEMENKACNSCEKLTENLAETESQLKELERCAEQSQSKDEEIEKLKIHIEELNSSKLLIADELKEIENKACNSCEKLSETEMQLKELELCVEQSKSREEEIEKLKVHIEELNSSKLLIADELREIENKACNSCEQLTEKLTETERQLKELELCAEQSISKDDEIEKLKIHIEELNSSKLLITDELQKQNVSTKQNKCVSCEELTQKLTETETKLTKFKTVAARFKKELTELRQQNKFLTEENEKISSKMNNSSNEHTQNVLNFQCLQKENDKLLDETEMLKKLNKDLQNNLSSNSEELKKIKEIFSNLEVELKQVKNEVNSVESEKQNLKKKALDLEGKLVISDSKNTDNFNKVRELSKELSKVQKNYSELSKDKESLEKKLDDALKERKQHSLMDLEMADYERTVSELTSQLEKQNSTISDLENSIDDYESRCKALQEEIKFCENHREIEEKRAEGFKSALETTKKDLVSAQHQENRLKSYVSTLELKIETLGQAEESCRSQLSKRTAEYERLKDMMKSSSENHQRITSSLNSKISQQKEDLMLAHREIESVKQDFENYKIRVHSVLKQQKSVSPAISIDNEENESLKAQYEKLKLQIKDFSEKLQASNLENDSLRDEYDHLLLRHNKIVEELEQKNRSWGQKLEEVNGEKSKLQTQIEDSAASHAMRCDMLVSTYKKQIKILQEEHKHAVEDLERQLESADVQIAHLQQKTGNNLTHNTPSAFQDETFAFDFLTQERQEGEGSECTDGGRITPLRQVSIPTIPSSGFLPLEKLLQSSNEPEMPQYGGTEKLSLELAASMKKIDHLAELLNESEANCVRFSDQVHVLKEEVRRLERNKQREEHLENMEYMKNVFIKFATLQPGSEKATLIPVLSTMLKLSPNELQELKNVAGDDTTSETTSSSSWGGYLHRWSGIT